MAYLKTDKYLLLLLIYKKMAKCYIKILIKISIGLMD